MKIKYYILFLILYLLLININSFAQSDGGGYSSSYLQRNISARAISMAGAYSAIVNEPAGMFYNPAGIGFLSDIPMINSSISILGYGRVQSSISYAQEISESFGLGLSFNSFYGGSFTARNSLGIAIGEMSDFQYNLAAACSYRIEFMSMGATIKYLGSSLNNNPLSANGVALDLGTKFDVFDLFSFGLSVQNISGMLFWNNNSSTRDDIPYTIRAGVAFEYGINADEYVTRSTITGKEEVVVVPATRYILIATDAIYSQYMTSPEFVLGIELSLHELLAFRGGISIYGNKFGESQLFPLNNWGAGISLRPVIENLPFKMNIDYAIANEYLLNNGIAHHFTLLFEF